MIGRLRRWGGPAVGGCVLALAVAVVFGGEVIGIDLAALSILGSDAAVLALAALAAVVVLAIQVRRMLGSRSRESDDEEEITLSPPSTRPDSDRWVVTDPVDATTDPPEIGETTYHLTARGRARRSTRTRAQRLVIETLSSVDGLTRAEAAERVHEGAWTDDLRAAAFVGYGGSLPLRIRFFDWLAGAGYRRGLEATLRELERLEASNAAGGAAPDRERAEREERAILEGRA